MIVAARGQHSGIPGTGIVLFHLRHACMPYEDDRKAAAALFHAAKDIQLGIGR